MAPMTPTGEHNVHFAVWVVCPGPTVGPTVGGPKWDGWAEAPLNVHLYVRIGVPQCDRVGSVRRTKKGRTDLVLPLNVCIYVHLNVRLVCEWAAAVGLRPLNVM
jgi:hypothetical protein